MKGQTTITTTEERTYTLETEEVEAAIIGYVRKAMRLPSGDISATWTVQVYHRQDSDEPYMIVRRRVIHVSDSTPYKEFSEKE